MPKSLREVFVINLDILCYRQKKEILEKSYFSCVEKGRMRCSVFGLIPVVGVGVSPAGMTLIRDGLQPQECLVHVWTNK